MQVLDGEEQRALGGDGGQQREHGAERLAALAVGAQRERRVAVGRRQRQERGEERHALRGRQAVAGGQRELT